jgi:molecular chaperone DnaK (HSP70)
MATFSVGIDLGTTNCALAFARTGDEAQLEVLEVPQLVAAGEVQARPLLPSFLYLPSEVELPAGALALPWDRSGHDAVGVFAREQGASVPDRLVASAKSWLSHAGADRRGKILPWGAEGDVPRVSPVDASARYLAHLRAAWDHAHPDAPLAAQDVVVTVPASFDAVARELTVEACRAAGLSEHLTLLEEPQAALYAWLARSGERWRKEVAVGDLILVVDVGGGTTDLSLIEVQDREGTLELRRVAVGDHILLGGDNMDLTLAHVVAAKLEAAGKALDDWQLRALVHGCRTAKEELLGDSGKETFPLVIPARGRRLVGGALRTELTRAELEQTLVEGFFPRASAGDRPQAPRRTGLTALGLPYATDPAITRHLAAFLARQPGRSPTAVLFNGGVTRGAPLRQRILEVLGTWGCSTLRELSGADPDLAVARGAATYGRVRSGRGVRIRGGTARAYYVGIERAGLAVPGVAPRIDAVCVAPAGMEEGSEVTLPQPLGLVVGEPAAFRFFASTTRRDDAVASVAPPAELEELPPIETTLEGESGQVVPVQLHARVTEVGTLDLSAVDPGTQRRWRLEYNVRIQ